MGESERSLHSKKTNISSAGCVIMASGMSVRFGSNKLLTDFGGKPLLQWILDTTYGYFQHRIVVTRHPDIVELCRKQGIDTLLHALPDQSDTIRIGLQAIKDSVSSVMFFPGDQPLLQRKTIASFLRLAQEHSCDILRASSSEGQGSPVLFPAWSFPELLNLPKEKTGREVIQRHPEQVRLVQVEPWELFDIDTQLEKKALEKILLKTAFHLQDETEKNNS